MQMAVRLAHFLEFLKFLSCWKWAEISRYLDKVNCTIITLRGKPHATSCIKTSWEGKLPKEPYSNSLEGTLNLLEFIALRISERKVSRLLIQKVSTSKPFALINVDHMLSESLRRSLFYGLMPHMLFWLKCCWRVSFSESLQVGLEPLQNSSPGRTASLYFSSVDTSKLLVVWTVSNFKGFLALKTHLNKVWYTLLPLLNFSDLNGKLLITLLSFESFLEGKAHSLELPRLGALKGLRKVSRLSISKGKLFRAN